MAPQIYPAANAWMVVGHCETARRLSLDRMLQTTGFALRRGTSHNARGPSTLRPNNYPVMSTASRVSHPALWCDSTGPHGCTSAADRVEERSRPPHLHCCLMTRPTPFISDSHLCFIAIQSTVLHDADAVHRLLARPPSVPSRRHRKLSISTLAMIWVDNGVVDLSLAIHPNT